MIPAVRLRFLPLWIALLLTAGAAPLRAQRPLSLSVGAPSAGWRPEVHLRGVLRDAALRSALRSGLPLRFHYRVELWQKDVFDRLVRAEEVSMAMLRSPIEEGYSVESSRSEQLLPTLADSERALEAGFRVSLRPELRGRYYYLATLHVETLSLSDVDELRRWLRGEARPAVEGRAPVGRAVGRGVRRAIVRLLGLPTRHYEVRTPAFTVR